MKFGMCGKRTFAAQFTNAPFGPEVDGLLLMLAYQTAVAAIVVERQIDRFESAYPSTALTATFEPNWQYSGNGAYDASLTHIEVRAIRKKNAHFKRVCDQVDLLHHRAT